MTKTALVTGGTGQDGGYLVELLLSKGYVVHAQTRQLRSAPCSGPTLQWHEGNLTDDSFLERLIDDTAPDEIYNLAAVARPLQAWEMSLEAANLNALVPQRICEHLAKMRPSARLFQASSSEIFGNSETDFQNESTCCRPMTIYAASKAYGHQIVGAYRAKYGLHASSGILFNHESPRRSLGYVTQKIAHAAAALSMGILTTNELDERDNPLVESGRVRLGNLDARRDFCFAGDVVMAMFAITQSDTADDYVIGSGETHSIAEFCERAFAVVGLDWRNHVEVDGSYFRQGDIRVTRADPTKLRTRLGWSPTVKFDDLVKMMVESRIEMLKTSSSGGS